MKNYLLFSTLLDEHNDAPFQAAKTLLNLLEIHFKETKTSKKDEGYNTRYKNELKTIFKEALQKAKEQSLPILALENSSFLGLRSVNKELGLDIEVLHVNDILLQAIEKKELVHSFKEFNACIYYGSDDEFLEQKSISKLLKFTQTKEIQIGTKYQSDGYDFLEFNKEVAFKMAGTILFDAYDSSCDFIVVNDIRSFAMLDAHQKEATKALKRPIENGMPIVSIAQVLLMSLGKVDPKEIGVDSHTVKPTFI